MELKILALFTRTPLHVGAGSSVGIVDLPIIRESHTGYPVIPGSSLKGVLADLWNADLVDGKRPQGSDVRLLFGSDDAKDANGGKLLVGESKLVVFPVRSAKGGFAWVTCPLALRRLFRELGKALTLASISEDKCLSVAKLKLGSSVILEEYCLGCEGAVSEDVIAVLKDLCNDPLWQGEISSHLVIVSDEMFRYFVENACEIAQHVKIVDDTGTAKDGAFFNQENVPAETLFFTVLYSNAKSAEKDVFSLLEEKLASVNNLIQIGADATTGLGWCSVNLK